MLDFRHFTGLTTNPFITFTLDYNISNKYQPIFETLYDQFKHHFLILFPSIVATICEFKRLEKKMLQRPLQVMTSYKEEES